MHFGYSENRGLEIIKSKEKLSFEEREVDHSSAVAGLYLERFMASPAFDGENFDPSVKGETYQKFINLCENLYGFDKMSEENKKEILEKYWLIFTNYIDSKKRANVDYDFLKSYFLDQKMIDTMSEEEMQEEIGFNFFGLYVVSLPKGKVLVKKQEAYIIFYFESSKDFDAFNFQLNKKNQPSLGGSYHRTESFTFAQDEKNYQLNNLLFVEGKEKDKNQKINKTAVHERQHFINDRLFLKTFRSWSVLDWKKERYIDYDLGGENELEIKDEVLAYIRDGSDGKFLRSALSSKIYNDIFHNSEELKNIIERISIALDNSGDLFSSADNRAVLVYHLITAPLNLFPDEIENLIDYYKERIEKVSSHTKEAYKVLRKSVLEDENLDEKDKLGRALSNAYTVKTVSDPHSSSEQIDIISKELELFKKRKKDE